MMKKYQKNIQKYGIKLKVYLKKSYERVHNDKYIKTKIKIYNEKVHTNFQHNKIPKDRKYCACLSIILLDSIFVDSDREQYPQIFLEECKYVIKDKNNNNKYD